MREVKPTQKPVPSSDIKDLFFNSGLLDIWATSLEPKYIDRFGNCHLTAAGMEWLFKELVEKFKVDMNTAIVAAGYITIDSFQQGADLPNNELTQRNHVLLDETTGEYYRWDGDLPKQVPAGSTPQSTGGIGKGAWVSVGDASLRSDIKNGNGSLIGTEYGKTLDEVIFGRIYEGGDAAEKVREVLSRGYSPMFMNGVHKFKTTVRDGDGNDCFALVPSNTTIYTESKGVILRPEVSANSFFSSADIIATDIYVQSCTAYGVAEGTTSPRLVSCFFPARTGDEGRIVRFNISEVNLVDFDKGYDAYTWSSYLTNTDIGWCETGYNFREGARAPTSLRLIGTGATSCSTAYNIERTTYSIMINAFADDADVGIKIGEAKGLSIIQPGFEYCKQFAIIGTDHWESTSTGINWQGAFCWQRVRKGKTDSVENYADWAVEVYRTFDSTFDFSGIDNDWVKRNVINFIKLKSCFGIHIDGIPPESIYVDPTGDSTYEDISLGDKCRNRVLNFYVNAVTGDDRKNGSETTPFASFSKVNFVLPNDMKGRRKVLIAGDVADRLVIKNKKSSLYDKSSSVNTLQIEGDGGIVNGISIFNVNMGDAGLLIKNISTTSNSYIESSTGFNIDTLKLKAGARLYITSSSGYIGNLTMETGAEVICQKGAQLKVGAVTGGKITSNSSIVYRDRSLDGVQLVQSAGGQIF